MTSTGTTIYDHTVEQLRLAGEGHSPRALVALLADTVIVRSPITDRIRFEPSPMSPRTSTPLHYASSRR